MGAQNIRPLDPVVYRRNDFVTYEIKSGYVLYGMWLNLRGQLTATAAENVTANVKRGDEWGIVKRIEIANPLDGTIHDYSGNDLYTMNLYWFNRQPRLSTALGAGAADPAFDSTLFVPFFTPGTADATRTLYDTGRYASTTMKVTWGDATDIVGPLASTAYVVEPKINVLAWEELGLTGNYLRRKVIKKPGDFAAGKARAIKLDPGDTFRRMFIHSMLANGSDTATNLDAVRLISGQRSYFDAPFTGLQRAMNLIGNTPDGLANSNAVDSYNSIRMNNVDNIASWLEVDLASNGDPSTAPNTYGLRSIDLQVDAVAAGTVDVITESILFPLG